MSWQYRSLKTRHPPLRPLLPLPFSCGSPTVYPSKNLTKPEHVNDILRTPPLLLAPLDSPYHTAPHNMSGFVVPSFGFSSNNLQGLGSPKAYLPTSVYQPIPAAGTPSFGFGRPNTPKEHGRHPSYSVKDIEPTIQSVQPSVERMRRHREYYLEGGDIYFLVRFRAPAHQFVASFADLSPTG